VCQDGADRVAIGTAPTGYNVDMPCDRLTR
jgi:hypothetical protein